MLYTVGVAIALLFLCLQAAPAPAAPIGVDIAPPRLEFVTPAELKARAETLHAAALDPKVSDASVKEQARGFFERLPAQTLIVPVSYRRMERERVPGRIGTIAGMLATAERRVEQWRRTHREPPPAELMGAMSSARFMRDAERLSYDDAGLLAEHQLGIYRYARQRLNDGLIVLNARLRWLAALVGEAFAYATVAHESRHALDHAEGRLDPDKEVAGEASAFLTQYRWLALIDPSGERMLTLHSSLKLAMLREKDPDVREALRNAVEYLEHLSDVAATGGRDKDLRELAERLYRKGWGHHHRDDGPSPPSA